MPRNPAPTANASPIFNAGPAFAVLLNVYRGDLDALEDALIRAENGMEREGITSRQRAEFDALTGELDRYRAEQED